MCTHGKIYLKAAIAVYCIVVSLTTHAQTEPQFTQYNFNRYLGNPAYAGANKQGEVAALYRIQYVSLTSKAISSQAFNFNMPLYSVNSGVGLNVVNDLIGLQRATYLSLNYAYIHDMKWGSISAGVSVGVIQTSLDGSLVRTPDGEYRNAFNHQDNTLPDNLTQGIAPDVSVGLQARARNYYLALAVNHIIPSVAKLQSGTKMIFTRTLQLMGGYEFKAGSKARLTPNLLLRSDFKLLQAELGLSVTAINNILCGISFRGYSSRSIDAMNLMAGFVYKGFRLVYSYDINLNYLRNYNTGSHEISAAYFFEVKRKEQKRYFYFNPRYN